jgi:hypothetical protein
LIIKRSTPAQAAIARRAISGVLPSGCVMI